MYHEVRESGTERKYRVPVGTAFRNPPGRSGAMGRSTASIRSRYIKNAGASIRGDAGDTTRLAAVS